MSTTQAPKENPVTKYPQPPNTPQEQTMPGSEQLMDPKPDHGETSYKGSGKLLGRKALITGGNSGIGKAVAIAFAREGADVLISYLNEEEDAQEVAEQVKAAGRKVVLVPGDISTEDHCKQLVAKAIEEFGQLDIIVNNAAYQMEHTSLQEISAEEWENTFKVNVHAMFYICKAAEPHLKPGSSVINTTSVNAYTPNRSLLPLHTYQSRRTEFHVNAGAIMGRKRHPRKLCSTGPHMDAVDTR